MEKKDEMKAERRPLKIPSSTSNDACPPSSALRLGWPVAAPAAMGFQAPLPRIARQVEADAACDDSDSHILVAASTGSGKGRSFAIPNLLTYAGSVVCIDPKGELYQVTKRRRAAMGQQVVAIDPFGVATTQTQGCNPLDLFALLGDEASTGTTLAEALIGDNRGRVDPFWTNLGMSLISGLLAHQASLPDPAERTLTAVRRLVMSGDFVYTLAVLLDTGKVVSPHAAEEFAGFLQHEGEKVRTSIRSEAQQHLRLFTGAGIEASLACSSVPLERLQSGDAVSIYLILPPDRMDSHRGLLRLWIQTLLLVMLRRRHRPSVPTLLLLDEFCNLGPMPLAASAVTLGRGYGIRLALMVQCLSQLRATYPRDWETIANNCGTTLAFGFVSHAQAALAATLFGDIDAAGLFALGADRLACRRSGLGTVVLRKLDYLHDRLHRGQFDPNPRIEGPEIG